MVKRKFQILLCQSQAFVNDDGKELVVVDHAIFVNINVLKDLLNMRFLNVSLLEGSPDICDSQHAGVLSVKGPELFIQQFHVEIGAIILYQKGKRQKL